MRIHAKFVSVSFLLVTEMLRSSYASDIQEFGYGEVNPRRDILDDGNHRVLEDSSELIEVLGRKDNALKIRIKQDFDRSYCKDGEHAKGVVADMFFATYTDPKSGKEICSLKRKADGCFSRVLTVGCDPKSNLAKVTIFVKSRSYPGYSVVNPKVGGRCFPSDDILIRRAGKAEFMLPCDFEHATLCEYDRDCPRGTYCPLPRTLLYSKYPRQYCIPYAEPGAVCHHFEPDLGEFYHQGILSNFDVCGTSSAFCRVDPTKCKVPKHDSLAPPGTCVSHGKNCSSDSECRTPAEYCLGGRCTPYVKDGECCGGHIGANYKGNDHLRSVACLGYSKCSPLYSTEDLNREEFLPRPPRICRPPCTKDADCVAGVEVCGPLNNKGLRYCNCITAVCEKDRIALDKFYKKYVYIFWEK